MLHNILQIYSLRSRAEIMTFSHSSF